VCPCEAAPAQPSHLLRLPGSQGLLVLLLLLGLGLACCYGSVCAAVGHQVLHVAAACAAAVAAGAAAAPAGTQQLNGETQQCITGQLGGIQCLAGFSVKLSCWVSKCNRTEPADAGKRRDASVKPIVCLHSCYWAVCWQPAEEPVH